MEWLAVHAACGVTSKETPLPPESCGISHAPAIAPETDVEPVAKAESQIAAKLCKLGRRAIKIGGVLIGTGLSVYMVVRSAGRMSKAASGANPAKAAADDDTDDEEPGIFGFKRGDE